MKRRWTIPRVAAGCGALLAYVFFALGVLLYWVTPKRWWSW